MQILRILLILGMGITVLSAAAGEVASGTVIEASTWDALKDQTFENHRISDLVPAGLEVLVREHGLKLPLRHSAPIELDPRYWSLTEQYAGQVNYDAATRSVSGYVAGLPFPDVQKNALSSSDSEAAATKLIWNFFYANPQFGNAYEFNDGTIVLIDGKRGIERSIKTMDKKFRMVGRLTEPHAIGDGSVYKKQVTMLLTPYDVRGLGTYFVRYTDGRPDDSYAYIKSVRRVRRLSGRTWMDPIGPADILNDDNDILDVFPTWYKRYNVLEETTILAVPHGPATGPHELKQWLDYENAPYWNPVGLEWEPRQVYVIEATPPSTHLYGKKLLYMEKEFPIFYMSDISDTKGDRWKVFVKSYHPTTAEESQDKGIAPSGGFIVDLQRYHATFIDGVGFKMNDPKATEDDYSLTAIQKMLR